MLFRIFVHSIPDVESPVKFLAVLPAGFVGPGIGRAMEAAWAQKLLGAKKFSKIRKVRLRAESSLSGAAIALIEEDIVPGGEYVTIPELDVLCDWPEVEDEFDKHFEKAGIQFGDSTVKPMVSCPLMRRLEEERRPPPTDPAPEGDGSQKPEPPKPPKRLKVYYTSALHEEYRGGDADYMKSLVDGMRLIGVSAVRIANSMLDKGDAQKAQEAAGKLVTLDYYGTLSEDQRKLEPRNRKVQTDAANDCLLSYLKQDKAKNGDIIQILNIQSRLPNTGSAFQTGETIKRFMDEDINVFITVHEWLHTQHNESNRFPEMSAATKIITDAATGTIVLNDLDHQAANLKNSTFIPIPITVAFENIDVDAVLRRPNRIGMFGMLRPGKGFKQAVDLGEALLDEYLRAYRPDISPVEQPGAVWIVGKFLNAFFEEFPKIVEGVYKKPIYDAVFTPPGEENWWTQIKATASRLSDDELNRQVSEKIAECEALRTQAYAAFTRKPGGGVAYERFIDTSLTQTNERPDPDQDASALMRIAEYRDFVGRAEASFSPGWALLHPREDQRGAILNFDLAQHVAQLSEGDQTSFLSKDGVVRGRLVQLVRQKCQRGYKKWLAAEKAALDVLKPLPVFFKFNLPEAELIEAFKQCKYFYKPDDKGLADNASAMISPMANGCILFTNRGHVTPAEFHDEGRIGDRESVEERYKLDFAARYNKAVIISGALDQAMEPAAVIREIAVRENDGGAKNRETLEQLKHVSEHRYLPIMVAARNVLFFRRKLGLDPKEIIVPEKEHQDI